MIRPIVIADSNFVISVCPDRLSARVIGAKFKEDKIIDKPYEKDLFAMPLCELSVLALGFYKELKEQYLGGDEPCEK